MRPVGQSVPPLVVCKIVLYDPTTGHVLESVLGVQGVPGGLARRMLRSVSAIPVSISVIETPHTDGMVSSRSSFHSLR